MLSLSHTRCLRALPLVLLLAGSAGPAHACGDTPDFECALKSNEAKWLLSQAMKAVQRNGPLALRWFTEQSHGFRTMDLYVFCIGPDNVLDAHPDPDLLGTDATKLVDPLGHHFGLEMIQQAREGVISDVTYLWPRLNEAKPTTKHTMYTRVSDQICAVGYYE